MASKVRLDRGVATEAAGRGPASRRATFQMRISERRLLLMAGDLVATLLAVFGGLYLWAQRAHEPFTSAFIVPQLHWVLLLPTLWLVLASANDYYNLRVAARVRTSLLRLGIITCELLVFYLAVFFLAPRGALPRRFIVYYAVLALVLTGVWRGMRLFLIGWTGFRRRVLIVGGGHAADVIWHAIKEEASADYEVVGCVSSAFDLADIAQPAQPAHSPQQGRPGLPGLPGLPAQQMRVLGTAQELPDLVHWHGVSELIMAYSSEIPDDVFTGVMACYEQGTDLVPMTTLYEQITGRIPIEHVGEHLWALVLPIHGRTIPFRFYLIIKRVLDIALAAVGLALFAVLLPFLALAIRLDSPGPVFYQQMRVGQGGRVFKVIKLRSMHKDAEAVTGPRWASPRDARITRVGRFLRKTRLDEMPQLVNVVRGTMSIVGPRPERPAMVETLAQEIPYYRARLAVKPGLTGWAQVCYRYGSSVEDALRKLQYDLYYIRHQSLALDLVILVRTIGTMLLLRGT